jgi:hypothetical protein
MPTSALRALSRHQSNLSLCCHTTLHICLFVCTIGKHGAIWAPSRLFDSDHVLLVPNELLRISATHGGRPWSWSTSCGTLVPLNGDPERSCRAQETDQIQRSSVSFSLQSKRRALLTFDMFRGRFQLRVCQNPNPRNQFISLTLETNSVGNFSAM